MSKPKDASGAKMGGSKSCVRKDGPKTTTHRNGGGTVKTVKSK